MRSKESRTSSGIEFINASQEVRRVYWLDYGGGRSLYAILAPWQSYIQQSYLTQPWIVDKKYTHNPRPRWTESACIENNSMAAIGRESYFMSHDGKLMPVRKNQPPPDLQYFKEWTK